MKIVTICWVFGTVMANFAYYKYIEIRNKKNSTPRIFSCLEVPYKKLIFLRKLKSSKPQVHPEVVFCKIK